VTAVEKLRVAEQGWREAIACKDPIAFQRSLTDLAVARRAVDREERKA
jgi:hypothetical protein